MVTWGQWPPNSLISQPGALLVSVLFILTTCTLSAIMSTDKELYKLELLSLVTRVSQELFNHTKLQDKNLAEFVIAVGVCCDGDSLAESTSYTNRARPWKYSTRSWARSAQTSRNGSSRTSTA